MDWSGESWPQFFFDSLHWRDFRIPYPFTPQFHVHQNSYNFIHFLRTVWTLMKVWDKEKIPETTLMRLCIRENNTCVYWLFSCRFRKGGGRPLPNDCWLRWFNLSRRRIYEIPIAEVSKYVLCDTLDAHMGKYVSSMGPGIYLKGWNHLQKY